MSGSPKPSYHYGRVGNPNNIKTQPKRGAVLMGGGTDQDPAFRWLFRRARGDDFLILTAVNDDDYNPHILPARQAAHLPQH